MNNLCNCFFILFFVLIYSKLEKVRVKNALDGWEIIIMKKKVVVLMLAALMAVSSFTGCQKSQNNTTSENTAGASVVDVEDAKSAVVMTIETYDVTQQDIYLYALQYFFNNGTVAAAVNDDNLDTLVNALMDEIKLEVVQQEIAKVTDGIELSDDEVQSYKDTANSFVSYFGEDFLKNYGIDRAAVENLFEREALVNKLKDKAIADAEADYLEQYNKQFKDTDFFSAYYVLFPSIKYENGEAVKDKDGNYVSLSSDEMEEIKKKAEELREEALAKQKDGDPTGGMEALAAKYGVSSSSGNEYGYVGRYSKEIDDVVAALEDDEISEIVETEAGYMIIHMNKKKDDDFKSYSIQSMASQSAQNMFTNLQTNWLSGSGVQNLPVNQDALTGLKLHELCEDMNKHGYSVNGGSN